jgi:hypothetical protein
MSRAFEQLACVNMHWSTNKNQQQRKIRNCLTFAGGGGLLEEMQQRSAAKSSPKVAGGIIPAMQNEMTFLSIFFLRFRIAYTAASIFATREGKRRQ